MRISGGIGVEEAAEEAKARFMEVAADPGILAKGDSYVSAKDYCAMIETILAAIGSAIPKGIGLMKDREIEKNLWWRFLAWELPSGELVRFVTAARIDEDLLTHLGHSWQTIGDVCVSGRAMNLWIVAIGNERNGRRASMWARAWKNPGVMQGKYHFATKTGKTPKGWKSYYFADWNGNSAETWVMKMRVEGVLEGLVSQARVMVPDKGKCRDAVREIVHISSEMERSMVGTWRGLAMSRNECDGLVPCWLRGVCYGGGEIEPRQVYLPRNASG